MEDINLTSTAFQSGGVIPNRYTCVGENISPALAWQKIPQNAKSLSLILDDPDAPDGVFTHWVLYNIPPAMDGLPENFNASQGVVVGRNSFGQARYGGPCPPMGSTHHYYFRLYAIDVELKLTPGATRAQVIDAMHDHILAETELIGTFRRA